MCSEHGTVRVHIASSTASFAAIVLVIGDIVLAVVVSRGKKQRCTIARCICASVEVEVDQDDWVERLAPATRTDTAAEQ